jgi:hypothetical protein
MNKLAIVAVIALPVAAATAVLPAGASTGVHFRVVGVHSLVAPAAKTPNSNIDGSGKKAVFDPTSLKIKETTESACEAGSFTSLTITNTSSKSAYVTFEGSPFYTAAPMTGEDICFYGGAKGDQGSIGLSNAANTKTYASTLTVTLKN